MLDTLEFTRGIFTDDALSSELRTDGLRGLIQHFHLIMMSEGGDSPRKTYIDEEWGHFIPLVEIEISEHVVNKCKNTDFQALMKAYIKVLKRSKEYSGLSNAEQHIINIRMSCIAALWYLLNNYKNNSAIDEQIIHLQKQLWIGAVCAPSQFYDGISLPGLGITLKIES